MPNELLGVSLGFVVGIVLGLLGGGGSILAVPIFLYAFRVEPESAFPMSLAVVGMSAFIGFLGHWRQGSVNLRVGLPFAAVAAVAAFVTARLAHNVPNNIRLTLFALFAFSAAIIMLFDSLRAVKPGAEPSGEPHFTPALAIEAVGVGALTALIGAGGGFVIVPALVYLAGVPVKQAIGSSLLIITLNSLSGFAGSIGLVPIDWSLVGIFTGVAAVGAIIGARLNPYVPQVRIKQGFALLILVLLAVKVLGTLVT